MSRGAPKFGVPPLQVVFEGVAPGSPLYQQLYQQLRGPIDHFYRAVSQNHEIGGAPAGYAHHAMPEGQLHYRTSGGQERLVVYLKPEVIAEAEKKPGAPRKPWDWVIVELVVEGLSPSAADDMATGAHMAGTCENTAHARDFAYPTVSNGASSQDNYTGDPVLKFAETPFFDQASVIPSPAPGTAVVSLVIDLRRFGEEEVRVDLTAGLDGGVHTAISSYRYSQPFYTVSSSIVSTLGNLDFHSVNPNGTGIISVATGPDDLWPEPTNGPHYWDNAANLFSLSVGSAGPFTNSAGIVTPPGGSYFEKHKSFPASAAPLPMPLDAGGTYLPGASTSPVSDEYLKKFRGSVRARWSDTGLVRQYEGWWPSLGHTTVTKISSSNYHLVIPALRTVNILEYDNATPTSSSVPVDVSLPAKMRWGAGFGAPPDDKIVATADHVTYSEWVMTEDPVKYANVSELHNALTLNNMADAALGQARINRYLHSFVLKS